MRRFLWWVIVLAAFGWSGFMAVYIAISIPDPDTLGIAQTVVWVVFSGIVMLAFWLLPMLGLLLLAHLVKPMDCITVTMRHGTKPVRTEAPPPESPILFCQQVSQLKAERRPEPYRVDGQVIAFRRPVRHSSNARH